MSTSIIFLRTRLPIVSKSIVAEGDQDRDIQRIAYVGEHESKTEVWVLENFLPPLEDAR